jgi:hypothetical protein
MISAEPQTLFTRVRIARIEPTISEVKGACSCSLVEPFITFKPERPFASFGETNIAVVKMRNNIHVQLFH